MVVLTVHIHVQAGAVASFLAATLANAQASRQEPGCARFDVLQHEDDPTRFVLFEIWKSPEAQALHRETPHYLAWKAHVEQCQAEPRHAVRYRAHTAC